MSEKQNRVATAGAQSLVVQEARALTVFRALSNGEGRRYTATTFPQNPHRGCDRFLRMCRVVGWVSDTSEAYAVLDVLDANGDIVQDFSIPNADAFQGIKRKLGLRVEQTGAATAATPKDSDSGAR